MKNVLHKLSCAFVALFALALLAPISANAADEAAAPKLETIIALPPVNQSTAAGAEAFFDKAIREPVLYIGYKALPAQMTTPFLLANGINNTATLDAVTLKKFKDLFDADAIMFSTITGWKAVEGNADQLKLMVSYVLKSTADGKEMWKLDDQVNIDLKDRFYAGKMGILSQVLLAGANAMTTSVFQKSLLEYAVTLNFMPTGPYNPTTKWP